MHVSKTSKQRNTPLFQKASKKAPTKITRKHKTKILYPTCFLRSGKTVISHGHTFFTQDS